MVVLIYISLTISDVGQLFMCLLPSIYVFSREMSVLGLLPTTILLIIPLIFYPIVF